MNKQLIKIFVIICCTFTLTGVSNAQPNSRSTFEIPFDFIVKGRKLPAGKYIFERLSQTNPDVLVLRKDGGTVKKVLMTQRILRYSPKDDAHLTFYRYGDIYYFAEIWTVGEKTGNELLPTESERKRRKNEKPLLVRITAN